MRTGVNPEKYKNERNRVFHHRVIIPIYIPGVNEEYYKESIDVLDKCVGSLIDTIDKERTSITLINNNSTLLINPVFEKYKRYIDKYVLYGENKGKVYAVLNEARGAYEPFVTIADADVLFRAGWEEEIWEVFNEYQRAGIVSPVPSPNNSFHYNSSLFFDNYLQGKLKYGEIIKEKDLALYKKSHSPKILDRNNRKFSWGEKQYYLDGKYKAIAGASHFVATYKTFLFQGKIEFPEIKFQNSYEEIFLDNIADLKGFYRLSTNAAFAYHMGNTVDNLTIDWKSVPFKKTKNKTFEMSVVDQTKSSVIPYFIKKGFFKILCKIKAL